MGREATKPSQDGGDCTKRMEQSFLILSTADSRIGDTCTQTLALSRAHTLSGGWTSSVVSPTLPHYWSCWLPCVFAPAESTPITAAKQAEKVAATREDIFQGE